MTQSLKTEPRIKRDCTIRLHHYADHKMWSIATDVAWSICLCVCVCLLDTSCEACKMAEPIDIQFGLWTRVGPRNHVLGHGPDFSRGMGNVGGTCPTPL